MNKKEIFKEEINLIKQAGLYRELKVLDSPVDAVVNISGREYINFSSNNYLGLATHPEIKKAAIEAIEKWGSGSGASRLICGTSRAAYELEEELAKFKSAESAIVFSTGYMANLGVITSIVGKDDVVIIDKLNHASIIDGCRMSGATVRAYNHCDMDSLEKILKVSHKYRRRLIITDALFSMEGDIAPLTEIAELGEKYDALTMVDEAHSTGVFGETGAGLVQQFGLTGKIDIQMGTLSKAVGCVGGYVAGSKDLIEFLRNKARSFIYSTALPQSDYASSKKSIEIIKSNPQLRKQLRDNITYFKSKLDKLGLDTLNSQSQIIPIVIGDPKKTIETANRLQEKGLLIMGIRPPTVKRATSRLRISIMATHTKEQLDRCIEELR